jgi:phage tail sheath protein FI
MANKSAKVTIEELPAAPGAIEGVSTSTVITAGWTKRGRTDVIVRAGSYAEVEQKTGTFWKNSYIAYALNGFFNNDGQSAYIRRVTPSDAVAANLTLADAATAAVFIGRTFATTSITTLSASKYNMKFTVNAFTPTTVDVTSNAGVSGSYLLSAIVTNINTAMALVDVSLSNFASLITQVTSAGVRYRIQLTSPTTGAASQIAFTAPVSGGCSLELFGIVSTDLPKTVLGQAAVASRFTVTALGAGLWGNDIQIQIVGDPNWKTSTGGWTKFDAIINEELDGNNKFTTRETYSEVVLDVDTDPAFIAGYIGARSSYVTVTEGVGYGIPRTLVPVSITKEFLGDAVGNASLTTFTGRLMNLPNRKNVTITTTLTGAISVNVTDNGTGSFSGTGVSSGTVDYMTGEISITFSAAPTAGTPVYVAYTTTASDTVTYDLASGTDGTDPLGRSDVTDPSLAATKGGIYLFNDITDEVLNVILPDFAGVLSVHNDLISWAETRKDIFVILDPAAGLDAAGVVTYRRDTGAFNTSYAALYWPWIKTADSLANGAPKNVPPSGHVAGVYARTDSTRNVAKAPAGVTDGRLVGTLGFERTISETDRDTVYPTGVNPMIGERQTGRAVWGARTLSLDKRWRYIQARRFFLFVEKSIFVNSWWTVFETIGPELFSRIQTNVRGFLRGLLAQGYFPTKKEEDAFAVVVDNTNNDDNSSQNGEVIIDTFLATTTPGEFIRFRFRQKIALAA